jgi:hypothetical protein
MKPYKIKYWKSKDTYKIFVFTRNNSYTKLKDEIIIPYLICDDDNINLLEKKLAIYLKDHIKDISPGHMYMWIHRKIIKNETLLLNFISNCFKTDKKITFDYFKKCIKNYFNVDVNSTLNIIDEQSAFYILNKVPKLNTIIEPIQFKYTDGGYFQYLPYDPFNTEDEKYDTSIINSYESLTLESYDINDNIINLIIYDKTNKLYFPYKNKEFIVKDTKKFIDQISEVEAHINNKLNEIKDIKNDYYISFFSARGNEINFNERIDLGYLFDKVHASIDLPFIKYRTSNNIYYKLDRKSIVHLTNDDIEKMKRFKQQTKIDSAFIQFKFKFSKESFCSLFLSDTFVYHIRYNLKKMEKTSLHKIEEFFKNFNAIIKIANSIYSYHTIPLITPESISIVEMTTNNEIKYPSIKYDNFKDVIKQYMYPYFNILNIVDTNILHLQYKKVDNYIKYDNIHEFITRNYYLKLEKEDMITLIKEEFSITEDEADKAYSKWENIGLEIVVKDEKKIVKIKNDNYVNLKIKLNSILDLDCTITGLKSIKIQKRLIKLLTLLVYLSTKKITKTNSVKIDDFDNNLNPPDDNKEIIDIDQDELPKDISLDSEFLIDLENDPEILAARQVHKKTPTNEEELPVKKGRSIGFILKRLVEHDPDLFKIKKTKFTTVCTGRQPIVLNKEEKDKIDREYPDSYKGYLKIGSTPELKNKHYYICPSIWCPSSKVSMSYKDYIDKKKCPDGEEPLLSETTYWGKTREKALTQKRFPGILDVNLHPNGLCVPCCFKLDNDKEGTRNKQRLNICLDRNPNLIEIQHEVKEEEEIVKESPNTVPDKEIGNPRYILNDDKIPVDNFRFGLISLQLGKILHNKRGNTGLLPPKTECYLRKGIDNRNSSFISAIINILDNPRLKTVDDFENLLVNKLTVDKYIQIENGKLLKLFINNNYSIGEHFKDFYNWFKDQDDYIKIFDLKLIRDELTKLKKPITFDIEILKDYYKDILREFIIYNSYIHFKEYIKSKDQIKDHRTLIDLINIDHSFININGYNIIIIEELEDKINMLCPFNRDTKNFINPNKPFIFLIKNDRFYEPLHYITDGNLKQTQYKFEYIKSPVEIKNLIKYFYNNCSKISNDLKDGEDICIYLESIGYNIRSYVIDYSFKIRGIILINNLYIPFPIKADIFNISKSKFIYYNQIIRFKCILDQNEIKKIFKSLNKFDKEFYEILEINPKYLVLKNKTIIPLNLQSTDITYHVFFNDLEIFLMNESEDERILHFLNNDPEENFNEVFIKYINDNIDIKKEIEFIIDRTNPLPKNFKRKKLIEILNKITNIKGLKADKLSEKLLTLSNFNLIGKLKRYSVEKNEILLDHHDVLNKKLDHVIEYEKDPYKLLNERLNNIFGSLNILDDDILIYKFPDKFIDKDVDDVIKDVFIKYKTSLTNYGFKKILSEDLYKKNYNYLYEFAIAINAYLNPRKTISIEMIKSIIKNRILSDFNSNKLAEFYENPSFVKRVGNLNNVTPEKCIEIFESIYYYPSNYELNIICELLKLNMVILSRQGRKKINGVYVAHDGIDVLYHKSLYYVLLEKHNKNDYYQYDIIIKFPQNKINDISSELNKVKYVYTQQDFNIFYENIIKNKLGIFQIMVTNSSSQTQSSSNNSVNNNVKIGFLNFANNSCYFDSLLVALFHSPRMHVWLKDNLFDKTKLYVKQENLNDIYKQIRKVLLEIYNHIQNGTTRTHCTDLRKLFEEFDTEYKKKNKIEVIEWKKTQQEPRDVINAFIRIFKIQPDVVTSIEVSDESPREELSLFNSIIINTYSNDKKSIEDYIPSNNKITYQDASVLLINVSRGYIKDNKQLKDEKTKVIPSEIIKLKEAKLKLVSIIVHINPNVESGHYVSYIKNNNNWYEYDDLKSSYKKIESFDSIIKLTSYICTAFLYVKE